MIKVLKAFSPLLTSILEIQKRKKEEIVELNC